MAIRWPRVSSRHRVIRPSAASSPPSTGASSPVTAISSRSTTTSGPPTNQSSGSLPANHSAAPLASGRSACCQPPGRPNGPPLRGPEPCPCRPRGPRPPMPRRPWPPASSVFVSSVDMSFSLLITPLHLDSGCVSPLFQTADSRPDGVWPAGVPHSADGPRDVRSAAPPSRSRSPPPARPLPTAPTCGVPAGGVGWEHAPFRRVRAQSQPVGPRPGRGVRALRRHERHHAARDARRSS